MTTHPITGLTRCEVAGEVRTLAFDMNAAAALYDSKGELWNQWLVERFLGQRVQGVAGVTVTPLTPTDTVTALYAMLASDREDSGRDESEKSLRRALSPAQLPDLQLALVRVVLSGFGVPGEAVEAVVNALDEPRARRARGTGTKP